MGTIAPPPEPPECPLQVTAGVDWFREVYDDLGRAAKARDVLRALQALDEKQGMAVKPWSFMGYEGFRTQRVRWGVRQGKTLWETSGEWAPYTWDRMPLSGGRTTRLDLQVTVRLSKALPGFGTRWHALFTTPATTPSPSRTRVGLSSDSKGLWCGTVGDRTRHSFWRVYDKGIESGKADSGRVWRIEHETKSRLAEATCRELRKDKAPATLSACLVRSHWLSSGGSWPIDVPLDDVERVKAPPRPEASAPALMTWLSRTVRPVVSRLLHVYTPDEIADVLGLPRCSDRRVGNREDS